MSGALVVFEQPTAVHELPITEAPPSLHEERQSLHAQVARHEQILDGLFLRYNELSRTACLPRELLVEIFWYYVVACQEAEEPFALLHLSHICRSWRNTAANSPALWSHVVVTPQTPKDWVATMLANSKEQSLIVQARSPKAYKRVIESLKLVLAQIRRIQSLRLALPAAIFENIRKLLPFPSPVLRSIDLDITASAYRGASVLQFYHHLPCLRDIHSTLPISAISRAAQPTVRSVYLDLHNLSWVHHMRLTGDLLSSLEKMYSLERIFISIRHDLTTGPTREVSLPHLTVLEVHGPETFNEWLLGCLRFPATTFVRLYCVSDTLVPSDSSFAIALATHYDEYIHPSGSSTELLELIDHARCDPSAQANPWFMPSAPIHDPPTLEVAIPSFARQPHQLLSNLLWALSSVRVLWLGLNSSLPVTASINPFGLLTNVLRQMIGVKTLILQGWPETSVAAALETSVDRIRPLMNGYRIPEPAIFPSLDTLVLKGVKFGVEGIGPDGFFRALRFGLLDRRVLRVPVRRIIIEEAIGLYEEDITRLEGDVAETEILWDEGVL